MSRHATAVSLVADVHIGRAARHGALLRYADVCRADARDAGTHDERDELLTEAFAAEAAAFAVTAEQEVVQ